MADTPSHPLFRFRWLIFSLLAPGPVVFFPTRLSLPMLYVAFFVFAVCASSIVVIGFTATKELFPVEIAGTSVGTVNLFPFLGGAVFMPFLGNVLDAHPRDPSGAYALEGYSSMLLVLLISAVIGLGCTLKIKETFKG